MRIIDVSEDDDPREVGFYGVGSNTFDVDALGDYAYLTSEQGMHVVDVSNPADPEEVGFFGTQGAATRVTVKAPLAYISDREMGLRIVDISSPSALSEIGSYLTQGEDQAYGVFVTNEYAYFAEGSQGLAILDISDPSRPVKIGSLDTSGDAFEVKVVDDLAYVAAGNCLRAIDIANYANPVEVGSFCVQSDYMLAVSLDVSGDHIFLGTIYPWGLYGSGLYTLRYSQTESTQARNYQPIVIAP
jgi:hypothetical protein